MSAASTELRETIRALEVCAASISASANTLRLTAEQLGEALADLRPLVDHLEAEETTP